MTRAMRGITMTAEKNEGHPTAEAAWLTAAPKAVLFGSGAWFVSLALSLTGLYPLTIIEQLFLLTPLVVMPLGLELIGRFAFGSRTPSLFRGLFRAGSALQPWAALPVVAAFYLPPGEAAAWLASGWMLTTALLGLAGLPFLWRIFREPQAAGFEAGLLYLPVGGIWLLITRLGHEPLGLGEPIILLTAVHFHFSGFAACVYAACAARVLQLDRGPSAVLFHLANVGVIGGTFLVAIGFLVSMPVKFAAIALYAASLVTLAVLITGSLSKVEDRLGRRLLALSVA